VKSALFGASNAMLQAKPQNTICSSDLVFRRLNHKIGLSRTDGVPMNSTTPAITNHNQSLAEKYDIALVANEKKLADELNTFGISCIYIDASDRSYDHEFEKLGHFKNIVYLDHPDVGDQTSQDLRDYIVQVAANPDLIVRYRIEDVGSFLESCAGLDPLEDRRLDMLVAARALSADRYRWPKFQNSSHPTLDIAGLFPGAVGEL